MLWILSLSLSITCYTNYFKRYELLIVQCNAFVKYHINVGPWPDSFFSAGGGTERPDVPVCAGLPSEARAVEPETQEPKWCDKGGAGSLALPGWTSESASPHPHPSPNPSAHVPQPHWTTRAGPWTMCWLFAGSHNHRHDHRSVNTDIWSLLEDKCAEFKQKAHTHAQVSPAKNTFIMFLGLLYI